MEAGYFVIENIQTEEPNEIFEIRCTKCVSAFELSDKMKSELQTSNIKSIELTGKLDNTNVALAKTEERLFVSLHKATNLETKIASLEQQVQKKSEDVNNFQITVSHLNNKIRELYGTIEKMDTMMNNLKKRNTKLEKYLNNKKTQESNIDVSLVENILEICAFESF